MTQRVVVVGATGQIGRPLRRELVRAGHAVTVFSRDPARARQLVPGVADYVAWSPQSLTEECGRQPEPADAVVYLAGSPLFDGHRHSRADVMAGSRARAGALEQPGIGGSVSLTAPGPVRARQFARALGRACGHRAWLPVPALLIRMALGVVTDILVRGNRVIPARISAAGYKFSFPVLDAAPRDLLGQPDDADGER